MKTQTLLVIILALALLVFSFETANAALGLWNFKSTLNIKGTSPGYAGKMVRKLANGQWAADIVSLTNNPPVVISLGWTYFTARETCDGWITRQIIKGGKLVSGKQIATGIFMSPQRCDKGARWGYSIGKHELKGTKIWRPEWSHGEPIP